VLEKLPLARSEKKTKSTLQLRIIMHTCKTSYVAEWTRLNRWEEEELSIFTF